MTECVAGNKGSLTSHESPECVPVSSRLTAPSPAQHLLTVNSRTASSDHAGGLSVSSLPCSTSTSPRQAQASPQPEELILEIKRLRDRSDILSLHASHSLMEMFQIAYFGV